MALRKKSAGAIVAGSVFAAVAAQADSVPTTLHSSSLYPSSVHNYSALSVAEYAMHQRDKNLRTLTITKAIADAAIGVICEWQEKGTEYLDGQNNIRIAEPVRTITGCVAADELPQRWTKNEEMHVYFMGGTQELFRHKKDLDKFMEVSLAYPDESGRSLNLRREWNISKEEVCLTTMETQKGRKLFLNQWGCFPVRNHVYFENMIARAGISPGL